MEAHLHITISRTDKSKSSISSKVKKQKYKCVSCEYTFTPKNCKSCGSKPCPRCKQTGYVVTAESNITKQQIDNL